MANEPRPDRFKRVVLGFYAWIGAFLLALVLPFVAEDLAGSPNALTRSAAVALGTMAWVPMLVIVIRVIRLGDEYVRLLHEAAAAVAFVATLLLILPLSWLVEAGFLAPPSLQVIFVSSMLLWGASLLVVKRRFERPS